jgi:hypothetical protein
MDLLVDVRMLVDGLRGQSVETGERCVHGWVAGGQNPKIKL